MLIMAYLADNRRLFSHAGKAPRLYIQPVLHLNLFFCCLLKTFELWAVVLIGDG